MRRNAQPADEPTPEELLACTTFADKCSMLCIPAEVPTSRRQLKQVFSRLERVRNALAHTALRPDLNVQDVVVSVQVAEAVLGTLRGKPSLTLLKSQRVDNWPQTALVASEDDSEDSDFGAEDDTA
jgi:hypothetical protein